MCCKCYVHERVYLLSRYIALEQEFKMALANASRHVLLRSKSIIEEVVVIIWASKTVIKKYSDAATF